MFTNTVLGLALLGASFAAQGEDDSSAAQYSSCMENSDGVTSRMLDCIDQELTSQDARLNASYKKLVVQLTPGRKQQLIRAQRLWVQYRDANCKFYADPDGGTAAGLSANECVLRETSERAQELTGMLE